MKIGFFLLILALAFSASAQEIVNVNFVQEGEVSKLVIETDKENVFAERFHVTEDKQIIVDLKNVKVSPKLLRGIDTSEFPGSTVYISGYKKPGTTNDVRFAIQLRDNVRSILESNENKIVLNIENRFGVFSRNKVQAAENTSLRSDDKVEDAIGLNVPKSTSIEDILENLTLSGPKKYVGKRISINVREIPVPDLLNMIADTSGFNIIIDQAVTSAPPLTLTLTNIPWDQALDTVMSLSKLVARKNSNILVVKTLGVATKEREEELAAQKLKEGLEPLVTRVFPINYAAISEMDKIIKDYLTKDRGLTQLDERTNSIIVKDTIESIERIKKIVETLDTQTPQILIEAKVVEASENYTKRIGLSRGVTFGYDPFVNTTNLQNAGPGFSFSSAPTNDAPTVAGVSIAVFKRLTNLNMSLELMESESKARIISSPKILTQNKKAATIVSTETIYVPTTTVINGAATTTPTPVNANLNLTVTPQVTNDGAISMQLSILKQSFGTQISPNLPPPTTSRNLTTNVLVENGSTVVLGGLYQTNSRNLNAGIPFLKNLPLLGWLFRTPEITTNDKSELIVFLTPRILNQEEAGFSERRAGNSSGTKDL